MDTVVAKDINPRRLGGCAYFSAFIVLLANIVYYPSHELVDHDRELTTITKERVGRLLDYTRSESFKTLQIVLTSLEQAANYAVERAKSLDRTFVPVPSAAHSHYSYAPSQFRTFSNDVSQNLNLVSESEPQYSVLGAGNYN